VGVWDDDGNDGGSLSICVQGKGDAWVADDTQTAARWHNHCYWAAGGRGSAKHEGAGSEAGSNL